MSRLPLRRVVLMMVVASLCAVVRADGTPTLDDLLNIKPVNPLKQPITDDTVQEQLREALTMDQAADEFQQAVKDMRVVSERLGSDLDAGLDTQRRQKSIIEKLNQVIAAAQSQCKSSSSSSSSSSQKQDRSAQNNSTQRNQQQANGRNTQGENTGQTGGKSEAKQGEAVSPIEQHRSEWGNLPQRLRDELVQGTEERFSPVYDDLTKAYYRRLAEEAP